MKTVTDFVDPVDGAAEALGVALELHRDRAVLLLLSGGSALAIPDRLPATVFGADLTVAVLDERADRRPEANNLAQLVATGFWARRRDAGAAFFDSRPAAGESAAALADRFEVFLRGWRDAHPDGVVIATLGMGEDGHTAGIFPGHPAALDARGRWVESCTLAAGANPHRERVTVTPRFLTTEVQRAVALVAGKPKHAVLRDVVAGRSAVEVHPAALWHRMPNVTLVTDAELP